MLKRILNIIFNLLSFLPTRVAYFFADLLYFTQNHIVKYRKKVIIKNLKNAFPTETNEKIEEYYKGFNRHLCDYAMETLILPSMSNTYAEKHTAIKNLEVVEEIYKRKQNVVLLVGHIFNWEFSIEFAKHLPTHNNYAVYKAAKNKVVNDFIIKSRSKYNVTALTMAQSVKKMLSVEQDGNSTFLMVADQRPFRPNIRYSLNFFNQDTPVYHGFDKLIRKKDFAVVYVDIEKTKRGFFTFTLQELKPEGALWKDKETIHQYYKALEKNIKKDPSNWLWSHKRWKYKKGIHY